MYNVKKLTSKMSVTQAMLAHILDVGESTLSSYATGSAAQSTVEKVNKAIERRLGYKDYLSDVVESQRSAGTTQKRAEVSKGKTQNIVAIHNGAIVHFINRGGVLSAKSYKCSLNDVKARIGDTVLVQLGDNVQFAVLVAFCNISNPSADKYVKAVVSDEAVA